MRINTRYLTVLPDHKVMVGELSQFTFDNKQLEIASHVTGRTTTWDKDEDVLDVYEGELLFIVYVPSNETVKEYPHLKDWIVKLFND